ncbi:hypothetical protein ACS0TY_034029 [Phlomoides rotata]
MRILVQEIFMNSNDNCFHFFPLFHQLSQNYILPTQGSICTGKVEAQRGSKQSGKRRTDQSR